MKSLLRVLLCNALLAAAVQFVEDEAKIVRTEGEIHAEQVDASGGVSSMETSSVNSFCSNFENLGQLNEGKGLEARFPRVGLERKDNGEVARTKRHSPVLKLEPEVVYYMRPSCKIEKAESRKDSDTFVFELAFQDGKSMAVKGTLTSKMEREELVAEKDKETAKLTFEVDKAGYELFPSDTELYLDLLPSFDGNDFELLKDPAWFKAFCIEDFFVDVKLGSRDSITGLNLYRVMHCHPYRYPRSTESYVGDLWRSMLDANDAWLSGFRKEFGMDEGPVTKEERDVIEKLEAQVNHEEALEEMESPAAPKQGGWQDISFMDILAFKRHDYFYEDPDFKSARELRTLLNPPTLKAELIYLLEKRGDWGQAVWNRDDKWVPVGKPELPFLQYATQGKTLGQVTLPVNPKEVQLRHQAGSDFDNNFYRRWDLFFGVGAVATTL